MLLLQSPRIYKIVRMAIDRLDLSRSTVSEVKRLKYLNAPE